MANNYFNPYNPYMPNFIQTRIDGLQRQKADLDNQINMLNQQMQPQQQAPIQQTFINGQPAQQVSTQQDQNFDFKGKWVANKEEAKNIANNNLPLILLDGSESKFYMKDSQGTLRTFKFEEVFEKENESSTQNEEIALIKNQMEQQNKAIQAILATLSKNDTNIQKNEESISEQQIETKKAQQKKRQEVAKGE